eukprot:CAMPEP_0174736008 /NCGR_PEP_ID=MMETSP1094-20130205/65938_1 /TAXON_ID=156173 /ORGANISM="Chrysochromulina brevifilum, Strain UTEX LB 985" /LENGTH=164 /DNA_ID=CAMNT_0015939049 /DNA_START=139 /DNA_END=635 /DNA_ORIENTATION=-
MASHDHHGFWSVQNPLWAHRTQLVRATQSESVLQEGPWVLGMHWLDGVGEEGAELPHLLAKSETLDNTQRPSEPAHAESSTERNPSQSRTQGSPHPQSALEAAQARGATRARLRHHLERRSGQRTDLREEVVGVLDARTLAVLLPLMRLKRDQTALALAALLIA